MIFTHFPPTNRRAGEGRERGTCGGCLLEIERGEVGCLLEIERGEAGCLLEIERERGGLPLRNRERGEGCLLEIERGEVGCLLEIERGGWVAS